MIFVKPKVWKPDESIKDTRPRLRKPYAEIVKSGCCVYCGAKSECIDRVRPWAKGGNEYASNLVPACKQCRDAKGSNLLTAWVPERVDYGISHSQAVADEYKRLTSDAEDLKK